MSETNDSRIAELKMSALDTLQTPKPAAVEKNTFTIEELFAIADEQQRFLIDDLIPDSEVFGIIGEDGIGKTQLMSQLALSIATKADHFLGLSLHIKHGNVLIVATEDSRKKFAKAIRKIAFGLNPRFTPKGCGLNFTEGSNFDDFQPMIDEIEKYLKMKPHDLVLVDALTDTFTMIDGEVNSNSHASKILSKFQHLCNTYECALGFVHHVSKTKISEKHREGKLFIVKNDTLGAGRITSKARTILALTHDPKSVDAESTTYTNYLHAVKVNLQSRHYVKNAIQCTFDTNTLLHDAEGMVDIDKYESAEPETMERTAKKPAAKEIDDAQHEANVARAFADKAGLTRAELVDKLKKYYGVGANKIEQKGGYLAYLTDNGLIVNTNGLFRMGERKSFEMPKSAAFDDDKSPVIMPPSDNLELPFDGDDPNDTFERF